MKNRLLTYTVTACCFLLPLVSWAQDTVAVLPVVPATAADTTPIMSAVGDSMAQGILCTYATAPLHREDTVDALHQRLRALEAQQQEQRQRMQVLQRKNEQLTALNDSLVTRNAHFQQSLEVQNDLLQSKINILQEKELLVAEKDALYRKALQASSLDSAKFNYELRAMEASIEAKTKEVAMLQRNIDFRDSTLKDEKVNYERLSMERRECMRIADSLRDIVVEVEKENVRKQEENKYLAQRAKEAEEKVYTATNRKKKVRPVQGIAMRFFRTPELELSLNPVKDAAGHYTGTYDKVIRNRNEGNIEFDFVTGASVMLWDLSKYFNDKPDTMTSSVVDLRRFDQQFAYDLGFYVAFGGSNLFKNFYVGPSFRFVDFFYFTLGVNVCEYEILAEGYEVGENVPQALSIGDVTAKTWLVKPFVSLSIDLDFLSYIKK